MVAEQEQLPMYKVQLPTEDLLAGAVRHHVA